jgi:hypothetical protein
MNYLSNAINELPSTAFLESWQLSCSHDTFLEILIMSVKNACLRHQHDFFKIRNIRRKTIEGEILSLKKNFHANSGEILRLERVLDNIVENELREEVAKMKRFERLNAEKITPHFMAMAKRPINDSSLSDITSDDGTIFENVREQNSHIRDFFANTYKASNENGERPTIEEFLGDISQNENVLASKLSDNEREELDSDLTITEFDTALENAKINTSNKNLIPHVRYH